jgi:sugar O-acyltransferase (sialic acid O-acetyltransferase NeuD family)
MDRIVIIGTSVAANNICKFIEKYNLFEVVGFAVNKEYRTVETYLGKPVFILEELDRMINKYQDYIFVAIQWNRLNSDRRKVYESLKTEGYRFANLISPLASINGRLIGDNCWITDFVCIDTDTVIGSNVFVKVGALVGDHTLVGDHCFIGAKSTVGGGVKIGEQSFIGLGAIVFDDTTVGKKCIVGAATALKRNLPDYCVFKTNSENYIVKSYPEDEIESKLQFRLNIR